MKQNKDMKVLVLVDDPIIRESIKDILKDIENNNLYVDYGFSFYEKYKEEYNFKSINIKKDYKNIINKYDLVFSLCSQVFPKELVDKVRCINFHFGILPYACGVAPITFSILNDIPTGYTIHLMNDRIDNGDIIFQQEVENNDSDTAKDIEIKCQNKLIEYLKQHLLDLIYKKYTTYEQSSLNRRYFSLKDLDKLYKIDIEEKIKIEDFIKKLRAIEIGRGKKIYFISKNNNKVEITINLLKEGKSNG